MSVNCLEEFKVILLSFGCTLSVVETIWAKFSFTVVQTSENEVGI